MRRARTVLAALWILVTTVIPARAAHFVVDTTADAGDTAPGDGTCSTGSGQCALRAAVEEANALVGADAVIVPAGTYVASEVTVTDALVIGGAGAEATVIDGAGSDTTIVGYADLALLDLTVTGGAGVNVGGGIQNNGHRVTLIHCTVRDNTAMNVGAGIYNDGGVLIVIGSTIHGNWAGNVGGGIHNEGALRMTGSTVDGNFAFNSGGGIINEGTATIENSTISGNWVVNTGGGILNQGSLSVASSTITLNGAGNTPGAGIDSSSEYPVSLTLENTILANNRQLLLDFSDPVNPQLLDIGPAVDCDSEGWPVSGSGNLVQWSAGYCLLGLGPNLYDVDAQLGPLQNNGGPTFTHALLAGSPAIDAANPGAPGSGGGACPLDDQRGVTRAHGLGCDIGAHELAPCGDGSLDSAEECDDGNGVDGDGCDSNCTLTSCGNGISTAGEECDDGNLENGDCCSSTCTLTIDDDLLPPSSGGAKVFLRENTRGLLKWSWASAAGMAPDDFGDPTVSTNYTLCLVDESGASPSLLVGAQARAGGTCDGKPCWRRGSSGFSYSGSFGLSGRAGRIKLSAGPSGAKISVKSAGTPLRLGRLPFLLPLRVVLRKSEGSGSFGSSFAGPQRNALDQFKATSD